MSSGGAQPQSLFVLAGDISGDQHASRLIAHLKKKQPDLNVWGVGGPSLDKLGVELLYRSEDLAIIGLVNIIKMLPMFAKARAHLLSEVAKRKPDAVLLVDFGGFNIGFAQALKKKCPEVPINYFISPQVWGSRPWRKNVLAACIKKILVIFPFEEPLYRECGVEAHFVGHPLTDRYANIDKERLRTEFCEKYKLDPNQPIVGIFPGSRMAEVRGFSPMLFQAVKWLRNERPEVQFVMSQANARVSEELYGQLAKSNAVALVGDAMKLTAAEDNQGLMAASDILWAKSGTTTLEVAMMEKPMIVFYKGDWLSFLTFLMFKTVKYVAWPNLLAGKMLVPELIQLDCRADEIVRYTRDWLDVPQARYDISDQLRRIRSYLQKGDFAANAAEEVHKTLAGAATGRLINGPTIEQNAR